MIDQPETPGDDPKGEDDVVDLRTERDIKARELMDNAFKVKGADFTNYAASLMELGQINLMFKRMAAGDLSEQKKVMMIAQGMLLTSSIDSKIFTNLSLADRIEAGKLAAQVIEITKNAGG